MIGFREKETAIIAKFYRLCYKSQFASGIPIVLIGRESGSGYRLIKNRLAADRKFCNLTVLYSCNEYNLNSLSPLYQILKIIMNYDHRKKGLLYLQMEKWIKGFEETSKSIYQDTIFLDYMTDYLIAVCQETSLLLSIENLHFASQQLIDMLKTLSEKFKDSTNIQQLSYRIYILGFYNLEEFLDVSLKRFIFANSDKGMTLKLKNYVSSEFKPLAAQYFDSQSDRFLFRKIWNVTRGNVIIFHELYTYLQKVTKSTEIKSAVALDLIPESRNVFYDKYLQLLSSKERDILELLVFLAVPGEPDYLNSCLKGEKNELKICYDSLLRQQIIYRHNSPEPKYGLTSPDLASHILTGYDRQKKQEKYSFIQEVFERYYIGELEKHMMHLKELCRKSGNKKRAKLYLFLLFKMQPGNFNSFRKVEIMDQLIQLESNPLMKVEYIIIYCLTLIKINKSKSASELLELYANAPEISGEQQFIINLLLFNLYISINRLDKAAAISLNLKEIHPAKLSDKLRIEYLVSLIRYHNQLGNFQQALKTCHIVTGPAIANFKKLLLVKAQVLYNIGQLKQASEIYGAVMKEMEGTNNNKQMFRILINLAQISFDCADYKECLNYLERAKKIAVNLRSTGMQIKALAGFSYLYLKVGETKKFLEHIYAAFDLVEPESKVTLIAEINSLLSRYFGRQKKFDKAISCARIAKNYFLGKGNILKKIKYTLLYAECLSSFAKKGEAQQAYDNLQTGCLKGKNTLYLNLITLSRAKSLLAEGEYPEAVRCLQAFQPQKENIKQELNYLLLIMKCNMVQKKTGAAKKISVKLKQFPEEYQKFINQELDNLRIQAKKS